jgi:hypothetical protein
MGTRSLMLVEDKGKNRSPSGMTSKKGNGKNNGNSKNNDKGNSKYRILPHSTALRVRMMTEERGR